MMIFVSYSRETEVVAKAIVADLESLGHDVWFDRELSGGQAWWNQILAAVRGCGLLVFLMHPKSLASVACTSERRYAQALGKTVLPVQVADGISMNLLPPELAQLQIVPYRSGDRAEVLALARAVASVPPAPPLPDPLPAPPEVPASYLGALAMQIDSAPALSYAEQSTMLVDLRKALREPESRVDADVLLSRLRKRRDLFAAVAEEIDALRERTQAPVARKVEAAATPATAAAPLPEPSAPAVDNTPPALPIQRRHPAWWSTLVGIGVGLATSAAYSARSYSHMAEFLIILGVTAASGLIAGRIAGRDARSWWWAGAMAALGFLGWAIWGDARDALFAAVTWGVGPGAIVGAVIGAIWRRLERQQQPHTAQ